MTTTVVRHMISAEVLKLRRNRGLMIWTTVLTLGTVVAYFTIASILHAQNPATYGPAGGVKGFDKVLVDVMGYTSALAAILIGVTAGAGDVSTGVFRDLAASGRSRIALFAVRVPGALATFLPFLAVTFALAAGASIVLAGGKATPDLGAVAQYGVWIAVSTSLVLVLAIGLSALLASRTIAVGVLMAWQMAVAYLLGAATFLGGLRQGITVIATDSLLPTGSIPLPVQVPLATAIVVIVGWAAVAIAAGAWRTRTMDA